MMKTFLFYTMCAVEAQSREPDLGIIPALESLKITGGDFTLSLNKNIVIEYGNSSDRKFAQLFHGFLKRYLVVGAPIHYTMDGYQPNLTAFIYRRYLSISVPKG